MIHQYENNGYNIVLDVNSGCVHVVDEPGYEVIACLNRMNENQTVQTLKEESTWNQLKDELEGKYSEEELRDILDDVTELTANGQLFVVDTYEPFIGEVIKRKTVVRHSACISHTTAILPANTVLQKKESITEEEHL